MSCLRTGEEGKKRKPWDVWGITIVQLILYNCTIDCICEYSDQNKNRNDLPPLLLICQTVKMYR